MTLTAEMEHRNEMEQRNIGEIYDAALNPALWPELLRQLSQQYQSEKVVLVSSERFNPATVLHHMHGVTDAQIQWYIEEKIHEIDLAASKEWINAGIKVGTAAANHQAFGSIENYQKAIGDAYEKCFKPANVHYQLGCFLEFSDYHHSLLGLNRSIEGKPFSDTDILFANRLTPHLRRALQIHRQLTHVKQQNERLYAMLDRMVAGVMLVNANGRVCYANHAAEKLLAENDALGVSARYGLKTANTADWHALKGLLDGAIKTGMRERHRLLLDNSPAGGVIGIGNARGKVPLMLTVTPLSEMSGYEDLASDGIAAGIFFTNPSAPRVLAKNLLQTAFLLGERECDVCEVFANTASLDCVAETLSISMHTVRSYFKSIYEKTGHHSQAELMKLLMGMTLDFEHIG